MENGSDDFYESKSIYLKKDQDILGLHATGYTDEHGQFQNMEAWANHYHYNEQFKYLGSVYRIFGPIEEEAAGLKADGWIEIEEPNKPDPEPTKEAA